MSTLSALSTMSTDRVLALSMRPKLLEDFVGQDDLLETLKKQFSTGRIPHFYLIHGPVGSGKTSLARILAMALQKGNNLSLAPDDWMNYKRLDINEINAANKNGIDDIRSIVETMRYQPIMPSRVKVVIMDEAHQLTVAAQNALITETEDVAKHVYYIFCTSNVGKIIPALQRRAYMITPKPLGEEESIELLKKAAEFVGFNEDDIAPLHEAIGMASLTSPGLILQAAEKFFSGIPPNESVFHCEGCKVDTMQICRTVASGSWKETSNVIKGMTKTDIPMVRNCLMGYLKTMLIKNTGNKALVVAKAIKNIADNSAFEQDQCLPSFLASVCIACEHIASGIKSR